VKRSRLSRIRLSLVLLVNGGLLISNVVSTIRIHRAQIADPVFRGQHLPIVSVESLLWLIALLAGIWAECFRWRIAKYVNVGFYLVAALWMGAGLVLAWFHLAGFAEAQHWLAGLVFTGVPCLLFAVVLFYLYRRDSPPAEDHRGSVAVK
jgi:hypothetical protein